jgi:hypothetical protein
MIIIVTHLTNSYQLSKALKQAQSNVFLRLFSRSG